MYPLNKNLDGVILMKSAIRTIWANEVAITHDRQTKPQGYLVLPVPLDKIWDASCEELPKEKAKRNERWRKR